MINYTLNEMCVNQIYSCHSYRRHGGVLHLGAPRLQQKPASDAVLVGAATLSIRPQVANLGACERVSVALRV